MSQVSKDSYGYRASIYLDTNVVKLEENGNVDVLSGPLTPAQLAATAIINEILHRLRHNKDLSPYVPQVGSFEKPVGIIMRCEWMRGSGKLRVRGENGARPLYHLVHTKDQAMAENGVFCCEESMITSLPERNADMITRNRRRIRDPIL